MPETNPTALRRTVTRDEFYAFMGPRDVHPRAERDRIDWIDQRTHRLIGVSTPGYLCTGPRTFTLIEKES